eukprot:981060-Rhodomonas_salina.1
MAAGLPTCQAHLPCHQRFSADLASSRNMRLSVCCRTASGAAGVTAALHVIGAALRGLVALCTRPPHGSSHSRFYGFHLPAFLAERRPGAHPPSLALWSSEWV